MRNWPVPKFAYGDPVNIKPLSDQRPMRGRVYDLHFIGMNSTIEYDVRYFFEGKDFRVRMFEDELEVPPPGET